MSAIINGLTNLFKGSKNADADSQVSEHHFDVEVNSLSSSTSLTEIPPTRHRPPIRPSVGSGGKRKFSGPSENERRLLPNYHIPGDAVIIRRPGEQPSSTRMPGRPTFGGFKPHDTITHNYDPARAGFQRSKKLACETSRGDNVPPRNERFPESKVFNSPKRRRIEGGSTYSRRIPTDVFQRRNHEVSVEIERAASPTKTAETRYGAQRSRPTSGQWSPPLLDGSQQELRNVERVFKSGKKAPSKVHDNSKIGLPAANMSRGGRYGTLLSSPTSNGDDEAAVVISDDDLVPNSNASGAASSALQQRKANARSNLARANSSQTEMYLKPTLQSPYFPKLSTLDAARADLDAGIMDIESDGRTAKSPKSPTALAPLNIHQSRGRLSKPTIQPQPDIMEIDTSIDELAGPVTIGNPADTNADSRKAISTLQVPTDVEDGEFEIPESPPMAMPSFAADIATTQFTSSRNPRQGPQPKKSTKASNGQVEDHSPFNLVRADFGVIAYADQPLRMDYDEEQASFVFFQGARPMGSDLSLRLAKIQTVWWAKQTTCKLLRIRPSRTTDSNSHFINLEFSTYEDVIRFIEILKARFPFSITYRDVESTEMEKFFERRRQIIPHSAPSKDSAPVDAGLEKQFLERRIAARKLVEDSRELDSTATGRFLDGTAGRLTGERDELIVKRLEQERLQKERDRKKSSVRGHSEIKFEQEGDSDNDDEAFLSSARPIFTALRATRSSTRTRRSPNRYTDEVIKERPIEKYSELHGLGEPWDAPVIFPPTGKRTTVQFEDLKLLDEGEWINDTLIEFYINWLFDKMKRPEKEIYAYGTHFYTALTSPDSGKAGINYNAVRRWTSKVDLYSYDYIIVPINENAHWYLALICHLPNVQRKIQMENTDGQSVPDDVGEDAVDQENELQHKARLLNFGSDDITKIQEQRGDGDGQVSRNEDVEDLKVIKTSNSASRSVSPAPDVFQLDDSGIFSHAKPSSPKIKRGKRKSGSALRKYPAGTPAIIILDSLGTARPATIRRLKTYLVAEGADKRGLEIDASVFQGINARHGIPMQDNLYDCGIFILGYLHKFMLDPKAFVGKLLSQNFDIEIDWPEMNPSKMRAAIRETLQDIAAQQKKEREQQKAQKQAKRVSKRMVDSGVVSSPAKLSDPIPGERTGISTTKAAKSVPTSTVTSPQILWKEKKPAVVIPPSPAKIAALRNKSATLAKLTGNGPAGSPAVPREGPHHPDHYGAKLDADFTSFEEEDPVETIETPDNETMLLDEFQNALDAHHYRNLADSATVENGTSLFNQLLKAAEDGAEEPALPAREREASGKPSYGRIRSISAPRSSPKSELSRRGHTPDNPVEID